MGLKMKWIKEQLKQMLIFILMMLMGIMVAPSMAGELTVMFTAPGDDGDVGTANEYLVAFSQYEFDIVTVDSLMAEGIVDTARFCSLPQISGTLEYCTLTGLEDEGLYWVSIKTVDEADNWSSWSNVHSDYAIDNTPPSTINDLMTLIQ